MDRLPRGDQTRPEKGGMQAFSWRWTGARIRTARWVKWALCSSVKMSVASGMVSRPKKVKKWRVSLPIWIPRLLDGPLPALKSTGGRRRQSRRKEGRMDGGEQTLEKHQADEYEQIRITRARARLCPEARSGNLNFCFFFLLEMSLTLNYWLLM